VSDHVGFLYNGLMYLFGGRGHADSRDGQKSGIPQKQNNDLWTYHFDSDTWTLLSPTGARPSPRKAPAWCLAGARLYLNCGWNGRDVFDDTWFIDLDAEELHWVKIETTGKYDARHSGQLVFLEKENVLLSFGGCSGFSPRGSLIYHRSVRQLHLGTGVWTRRPVFGSQPRRGEGHCGAVLGDYWYIFGGHNIKRYFNRLYRFHFESSTWERYFGLTAGFSLPATVLRGCAAVPGAA
jgi:hypothetical protein